MASVRGKCSILLQQHPAMHILQRSLLPQGRHDFKKLEVP